MHLIFDFDGTIANVLTPGLRIISRIAKRYHVATPINIKLVRSFTLQQVMEHFRISRLRLFCILLLAKRELNKEMTQIQPFPGIKETIQTLAQQHSLYILSSNSAHNIATFLKTHRMEHLFQEIITTPFMFQKHRKIQKLMKQKNISQASVVMIGDELRDIQAARKARIKVIATPWGFDDKNILISAHPDAMVDTPQDIEGVLKTLGH